MTTLSIQSSGRRERHTAFMAIAPTLDALLERIQDLGPVVLAGRQGGHRHVGGVASMTDTGVPGGSTGDVLVVAAASAVAGAGPELVLNLSRMGAAGLMIVGARDLSVDVVEHANNLGFPVITVQADLDPSAVVIDILNAVVCHQREGNSALEDRYASITLEELLSADPHRVQEAMERAANFGWDLHRPRAVLLASIDPPVEADVAARTLGTLAASARATLGDDAIVWARATSVAVLLADDPNDHGYRRQLAEALRIELDHRVRHVTLSIGVGRTVTDPRQLATSFIDANRAVDVGRWAKGRHVTELYDELGLERLFASVPEQDLHDFVLHAIGPLLEHDRRHRTVLVETMSMWLHTRNVAEAARQMFVHYNTFKNRLERIETIVGPLLNDPARLLECEVAIHVARHYDGPWTEEAASTS